MFNSPVSLFAETGVNQFFFVLSPQTKYQHNRRKHKEPSRWCWQHNTDHGASHRCHHWWFYRCCCTHHYHCLCVEKKVSRSVSIMTNAICFGLLLNSLFYFLSLISLSGTLNLCDVFSVWIVLFLKFSKWWQVDHSFSFFSCINHLYYGGCSFSDVRGLAVCQLYKPHS